MDAEAGASPVALVVEDDVKFAALLARALMRIGMRVELAVTGDGALNAMRSQDPVVVVLDVMIPHPDGIEVCSQLRRDGWDGPVVLISARCSPADRAAATRAGADAFLAKPFRLAELLETVDALVSHSLRRGWAASS